MRKHTIVGGADGLVVLSICKKAKTKEIINF